ncbi:hypothetical protein J8I87_13310 [Paraburkholderia sp. LEh10]|jgi:hypothetical protein|uniref:hypothetical protein n=1 Tax=Paraburkholderia sp. LEh10 TaxID=2821353 RepID=UPI001AE6D212|nr:hypothetical protein [Paraburkholderia sp. LEh10]MBP0590678.1 hypothetical protein [Paraburkholderia sp. LEh10]
MNRVAGRGQSVHVDYDLKASAQQRDAGDESKKGPSESFTNWAWSTGQGHYDWMDSHVPFATLD